MSRKEELNNKIDKLESAIQSTGEIALGQLRWKPAMRNITELFIGVQKSNLELFREIVEELPDE